MLEARWSRADTLIAAGTFAAVVGLVGLASHFTATAMNNYVLLADAWLHGHSWIAYPGAWIDAVPYHGRAYVIEAPFPAVLALPLVAISGPAANQNLVAAALAGLAAAAMYRFARYAGDRRGDALLLTAFMLCGTDALYAALDGSVWLVAHLSALTFTLLALGELAGKRRLWLVTLLGLAAALSRYPMALALPVYWWVLRDQFVRRRPLAATAGVALPLVALWCAYNWNRWGTLHDPGFSIWYRVMDADAKTRPAVFSLAYLPAQIRLFFFTPPKVLASFPWFAPDKFGTALTYLSTGFAVAFAVRARDRLVLSLIALAALTALPALLYYDNGGVQFGVRHALDFEAFLLCLIAISLREPPLRWKRVLLGGSAAFALYLLYVWRAVPGAVG